MYLPPSTAIFANQVTDFFAVVGIMVHERKMEEFRNAIAQHKPGSRNKVSRTFDEIHCDGVMVALTVMMMIIDVLFVYIHEPDLWLSTVSPALALLRHQGARATAALHPQALTKHKHGHQGGVQGRLLGQGRGRDEPAQGWKGRG
jgi:hypothetical protein